MGNTLGGVNRRDPDKSSDLLGGSAPTLREDILWEKMGAKDTVNCALDWKIHPHTVCAEKSFNVFSKMCLLLPLFAPLILLQTQTSYP